MQDQMVNSDFESMTSGDKMKAKIRQFWNAQDLFCKIFIVLFIVVLLYISEVSCFMKFIFVLLINIYYNYDTKQQSLCPKRNRDISLTGSDTWK